MDFSKSGDSDLSAPNTPVEPATVTLIIPCLPEYVGTARLTILGVGSRMGFSYDQIEDIRLAVGEACANAIDRAGKAQPSVKAPSITIHLHIDPSKLVVEVEDAGASDGATATDPDKAAAEIDGMDSQELGVLLMEILVDEFEVGPIEGGGTRVRLTKYAQTN